MPGHLLDEIRIEQLDGGNFRVDAELDQMLVDQRATFSPTPRKSIESSL